MSYEYYTLISVSDSSVQGEGIGILEYDQPLIQGRPISFSTGSETLDGIVTAVDPILHIARGSRPMPPKAWITLDYKEGVTKEILEFLREQGKPI